MLQLKNKFPILLCLFLGLLFDSHQAISQNSFKNKTNRKIWEAKDRNDVVYTKSILKSGTNNQKILALKGLQSWQDSSLRKPLLRLVKKGNTAVKIAALEAIGQTRDSFYIPSLLKIVNHKKKQKLKPAALVALGKCITKSKVDKIVTINNTNQPGYAECVYRAMLKGVGHPDLTKKAVNLLIEGDYDNKFYSAWYLARTPHVISPDDYGIFLNTMLKSSDILSNSELSFPLLIAVGKLKATGNEATDVIRIFSVYLLKDIADEFKDGGLNTVSAYKGMINSKQQLDSADSWSQFPVKAFPLKAVQLNYSELIVKNCKTLKNFQKLTYSPALVNILKNRECNDNNDKLPVTHSIYDKIWHLQVLENDYNFYPAINTILMQTEEPAVKSSATESLIKCRNSKGFPDNLISDFNETITLLIKDADEGALSIIANAILEKQITIESNYRDLFVEAQSKLKLPQEMEAYIDISKVLAMIDKTTYKKPLPEWNHPINWDYVSKIREDQKIKVTTNQGEFIIQMNVNEAPGSVASILKLVEEGFYNGKYFHRMVPNFVVQGGCPRGDGFGGVNYTIRSEFSSLKYSTGAVGLASSGPDTESCQWFVTHCPTPHLDGRYTIIGYVVKGMETIHKLGVGDKMIKVERL
jgi:cyclophilin family peptidyl-prolyl cis-trans isomerase